MKRHLSQLALAAGVSVVTLALFLIFLDRLIMPHLVSAPRVKVPKLQGLSVAKARQGLENWGLRLAISDSVYHDHLPVGAIVDQDPPPGLQIRKGRRIAVSVSKGRPYYTVPDVRGTSLREARLQLEANQLALGEIAYVSSERLPEGAVIRATPPVGTKVLRGTPIDLEISSGPPSLPKVVPTLEGLPIEQVEDTLRKYEMHLGQIATQLDNQRPAGTVLSQSPRPGERALPLSRIDLVVSVQESTATRPEPLAPHHSSPGRF